LIPVLVRESRNKIMKIYYEIFEIREIEKRVTFAGYSDGYGRETETIYACVIPPWSCECETESDAIEILRKMSQDFVRYEIKKVYKFEQTS
jgi:hypothetical protein